jgi:hypothetical protein
MTWFRLPFALKAGGVEWGPLRAATISPNETLCGDQGQKNRPNIGMRGCIACCPDETFNNIIVKQRKP